MRQIAIELEEQEPDRIHEVMIINIKNMNDIVECYGDIYADNLIVMIAGELRKFGRKFMWQSCREQRLCFLYLTVI